jgi:hypothetical protein
MICQAPLRRFRVSGSEFRVNAKPEAYSRRCCRLPTYGKPYAKTGLEAAAKDDTVITGNFGTYCGLGLEEASRRVATLLRHRAKLIHPGGGRVTRDKWRVAPDPRPSFRHHFSSNSRFDELRKSREEIESELAFFTASILYDV